MTPLRDDPVTVSYLSSLSSIPMAVIVGFALTNIFQSSSILTGLVVLLVGSGFITLEQSIPLILGANIGTVTPLIASMNAGLFARRAAAAHALFNLAGVIIILPFIPQFMSLVIAVGGTPAQQAANAHTLFNVMFAGVFLLALKPIERLVERLVPGKEEEILFRTVSLDGELPAENGVAFREVEGELRHLLSSIRRALEESESLFSKPDSQVFHRILKRESLNDYLDGHIGRAARGLSHRHLRPKEASRTVLLLRMSNALEQMSDTIASLAYVANSLKENGASMSPGARDDLSHVYARIREDLELLAKEFPAMHNNTVMCMRQNEHVMRRCVNAAYSNHLERLQSRKAYAANAFVKAISRLDSAHAKVREIRKLCEMYVQLRKPGPRL
jgi:phosphate:Na+ symporter